MNQRESITDSLDPKAQSRISHGISSNMNQLEERNYELERKLNDLENQLRTSALTKSGNDALTSGRGRAAQ